MQYYFIINAFMFSRLIFGFRDKPISKKKLILVILIQLLLFLFLRMSINFILLSITVIIFNFIFYRIEQKTGNLNFIRFISLIIFLILLGIFSSILIPSEFNSGLLDFIYRLRNSSILINGLAEINYFELNLVLMGILLLLNETNFVIRYFFEKFKLVPPEVNGNENKIDTKEYNAGRIIGMLERLLIFFFVLLGQYAAIGFIIAAKGFTRFRELDNRNFAEYVLIGTFLSSLAAILIAVLIKHLMIV